MSRTIVTPGGSPMVTTGLLEEIFDRYIGHGRHGRSARHQGAYGEIVTRNPQKDREIENKIEKILRNRIKREAEIRGIMEEQLQGISRTLEFHLGFFAESMREQLGEELSRDPEIAGQGNTFKDQINGNIDVDKFYRNLEAKAKAEAERCNISQEFDIERMLLLEKELAKAEENDDKKAIKAIKAQIVNQTIFVSANENVNRRVREEIKQINLRDSQILNNGNAQNRWNIRGRNSSRSSRVSRNARQEDKSQSVSR